MAGKFEKKFMNSAMDIGRIYNRSIRSALAAGIAAAVRETHQDSSNAAYHWMVAERSRSRPGSRARGTVRDLRATKGVRGPARSGTPPVGLRGDGGRNAYRTLLAVRNREREEVIDKMVAGRNVSGRYYFYHGLIDNRTDLSPEAAAKYKSRAKLARAGKAAVKAVKEVFYREVEKGNVRRRPNA